MAKLTGTVNGLGPTIYPRHNVPCGVSLGLPFAAYIDAGLSRGCGNVPCPTIFRSTTVKMRFYQLLVAGVLAPAVGLAAPASNDALSKRENLCSLKAPPELCKPDPSVTVEETAKRAYEFYRAFVVDGDPKKMFSLIDSTYKVSQPLDLKMCSTILTP